MHDSRIPPIWNQFRLRFLTFLPLDRLSSLLGSSLSSTRPSSSPRGLFFPCMCLTGYIHRNCTEDGWSETSPPYEDACEFAEDEEAEPEVDDLSDYFLVRSELVCKDVNILHTVCLLSVRSLLQLQPPPIIPLCRTRGEDVSSRLVKLGVLPKPGRRCRRPHEDSSVIVALKPTISRSWSRG